MHSTAIFLFAFGLLITITMAWPWSGNSHGHTGGEGSHGSHGHKWVKYRSPKHIRLPGHLAAKLGHPWPAFTAKKVFHGKYMLISPALLFKIKQTDNTGSSTTNVPEISTTQQPEIEETTAEPIVEESTAGPEPEETTATLESFFKQQSYAINNDEQLYFFDE
ncbi:unnamed protein product [Rotaria sp. Silwood1]|nr:unnamed protein product [Rotaria sp. Silwood1]CAF0838747.1 unnamed protein product [Rotaria sp. Silwood1]CAF3340642.1 unnamed protein product [Rotaria sp. Silwood1]CAF3404221.1 unnamed protein product [Rotaria sp. Silwood1]CAF4597158.1 unnamed protein product [Rotaria sp. Silwood1]